MAESQAQNYARPQPRKRAAGAFAASQSGAYFQRRNRTTLPVAKGAPLSSSASLTGKELLSETLPDEKKEDGRDKKKKCKVRGDAPCVSWVKFGLPVRAVLLCVHGLALNSSSFEKFGKDMSQLGIATYAIDVRGFGSWVEAKGHSKVDFKDCIEDVKGTLEWLRRSDPDKPVFVLGESMGGAIALHAAAQFPDLMKGVVSVCSSAERFGQKKTDLKVFLHALTGPTREFDIGKQLVEQAAGDNTALKESWKQDELSRMELSPLELMQFQSFMNENHEMAEKITTLPVLMVQGRKDELVKPEGTEELYNELKTSDKELYWVADAGHLIFENSQYAPETLSYVADWILKRSPAAPGKLDVLASSREALAAGNAQAAILTLKESLKTAPADAEAHLLMGQAQLQLNHHLQARQHLVQAVRLGRGSQAASQANKLLMMLPQNFLGPKRNLQKRPLDPQAKPSVIVFNASWCKPCQDMNKIVDEAKQRVGQKVNFSVVDVDEKANQELVDKYDIGPVPTTVFLTADGTVAGFQVGYDGVDGMLKGMQKIVQVGGPQQLGRGAPLRPGRLRKRPPGAAYLPGASSGY